MAQLRGIRPLRVQLFASPPPPSNLSVTHDRKRRDLMRYHIAANRCALYREAHESAGGTASYRSLKRHKQFKANMILNIIMFNAMRLTPQGSAEAISSKVPSLPKPKQPQIIFYSAPVITQHLIASTITRAETKFCEP